MKVLVKATTNFVINPTEFFREKVSEASTSLKIALDHEVEFYVVNLLCDFITPQKFEDESGTTQDVLGTPLAFMLQRAFESESEEQKLNLLKKLGDTSLYVAGYFQDYFNRKTFDIGYYIDVGSQAYELASRINRPRANLKSEVFANLSENFPQFVDLFAEISEDICPQDHKDVLAVYDRWVHSQSDRLRKILNNLGIDPVLLASKHSQ